MQFPVSIIALLSAAATLTAAAPSTPIQDTPLQKRDDCVVNSANTGVWHEHGLSRWRTAFSCEPAEMCASYCDYFKGYATQFGGSNIQCWQDGRLGWTVDASYVLGPAGDSGYRSTLSESRSQWVGISGCRTG